MRRDDLNCFVLRYFVNIVKRYHHISLIVKKNNEVNISLYKGIKITFFFMVNLFKI